MTVKYCTNCDCELYCKGWILCDNHTGKQHNPNHLEIHFQGAERIAVTEFNTALQLLEQQKKIDFAVLEELSVLETGHFNLTLFVDNPLSDTSETEQWTYSKFKDEFFICLSRIKDLNTFETINYNQRIFLTDYKYYAQARRLIYRVPISRTSELILPFIINLKDLTARLYSEFKEFVSLSTEKEIAFFLKEISIKFFEAINYAYTHNSVISHLKVGYED